MSSATPLPGLAGKVACGGMVNAYKALLAARQGGGRKGRPYGRWALLGLLLAVTLSGGSIVKGLIILIVGLLFAMVGLDAISGKIRFTFGSIGLQGGFDFVTLAMGVFGLGEILYNLESTVKPQRLKLKLTELRIRQLFKVRPF